MVKIIFEYRDSLSKWKWKRQVCVVSSITDCKKIYGLGTKCDYKIISIENLDEEEK